LALMFVVSAARFVNNWPTVLAALLTEAPLQLQTIGIFGTGMVGLLISAVLVGLVLGAAPLRLKDAGVLPDTEALKLGAAAGLFAAAASALAAFLRSPAWARLPNIDAAGTFVPLAQPMIDPARTLLMASAVMLPTLLMVDQITGSWTRRRFAGIAVLAAVGIAAAGVPPSVHLGGWLLGAAVIIAALIVTYATLLRFDPTMVPIALSVMTAVGAVARGAERPFPGALIGALAGALLSLAVGWWWFRALRRARAAVGDAATV
jgi:hypothetical protein